MFQVVIMHHELIFTLLISLKSHLGEVKEAMFQWLACHFNLVFGLLTITKCN